MEGLDAIISIKKNAIVKNTKLYLSSPAAVSLVYVVCTLLCMCRNA